MKAANSVEPAKFMPALKNLKMKGVTGEISFNEKGDMRIGAISFYTYKDGKWVSAE